MSHLIYSAYPGFGDRAKTAYWYSQAVRVKNQIHISGQGGWDRETEKISEDLETEMNQAFENVDVTLKVAGGTGWDQVFKINSYHVDLDDKTTECLVRMLKKHCPNHQPLITAVGVDKLSFPGMRVEVEVIADLS